MSEPQDTDYSELLPDASMARRDDILRLERKVDKLTNALTKLLIFEERQNTQGQRIGDNETDIGVLKAQMVSLEKKLDKYFNMFLGVCALSAILWVLFEFFTSHGFLVTGAPR